MSLDSATYITDRNATVYKKEDALTTTPSKSPQSQPKATGPGIRSRRTGTTRQRLGCLTCRHRRKKCDEIYPICGHCRRLNLVCKREEPRNLLPGSNSSSEDEGAVALSPRPAGRRTSMSFPVVKAVDTSDLGTFIDPDMGTDTRMMLSYYTQVLAGLLTTTHDNNSFLSVFLPMAMDSIPLQKSLIAWSSAHLSSYSKPHLLTALENRSSALLLVAAALSAPILSPAESETILAACLVLCSTEVALGDTCHWYQHLLGARQIILAAHRTSVSGEMLGGPTALMKSRDGQWLLRNFAYHDVLGAVTTLEPPLIIGPYWLPPEDNKKFVDSYVGIGSKVLAILSEVCALDAQPSSNNITRFENDPGTDASIGSSQSAHDFWQTAADIETRLQQWVCPDSSERSLVELAESYRSASLIVLYRKQRMYLQDQDPSSPHLVTIVSRLATAVEATMLHISLIPMQALPECGLLFPLFMAGGDTLKPADMEVVRARLSALKEHRGFRNLGRATEVLEELWRCRVSGYRGERGGVLDWLDVLKGKKWRLTLC